MEVSLLDVSGLPEDSFISVHAGSTRRQAPANAESTKLIFPGQGSFENAIKVDFFTPLGSAMLQMVPGKECYPIHAGPGLGGSSIDATLLFRECEPAAGTCRGADGCSGTAVEPGLGLAAGEDHSPGRNQRLALEARAYLDEHQLLLWLQDALDGLIHEQPSDPWCYIEDLLPHRGRRSPSQLASP
eukprot:CAMPEP_0168452276 /NCGR_PEP_ID=MMETSP0228-20121227/49068_1 /TAXON_ID=133427 /ORGANISM="Protoceratium reticulatum, Strain CCCM 535 (=CCMP 1889)" /LENGTH=185 /DNA_ID=CAMNT_0008466919 /DNA_START=31 /DNA_END=585 /DNA_ORIENTATION=+